MNDEISPIPHLRRDLGLFALILLTVSAITPASSMFIEMPVALSAAGTGIGLVIAISALIGVIMAAVYSELGSAFPSCGGEYVFASKVLDTFGQPVAYAIIVMNIVVMALIPAVLGVGSAEFFEIVLPGFNPFYVALVVVGMSTLFGILNLRLNAGVTGLFLVLEAGCMLYFLIVSSAHIDPERLSMLVTPPFKTIQNGAMVHSNLPLLATAAATVLFAFNGYEQAIYLLENVKKPRNILFRAIIISLAIGLIFEALPTLSLILSSKNISTTLASPSPYLDFISVVSGPRARIMLALAISVAVLNASIVNILMTARFVFSLGRDNVLGRKIGGYLARIERTQGTPWIATLLVGVAGSAACLIPLQLITVLTGMGLTFIYLILCVCVIVGRLNGSTSHSFYKIPFGYVAPIAGMIGLSCVIVVNWLDPTTGRTSVYCAIIEASVGIFIYVIAHFVFGHNWTPVLPHVSSDD